MTEPTAARRFRIKAICDDVSSCECCGKTGLKRTVAIEDSESGEIRYFGTTCAMQPVKGFGIEKAEMARSMSAFKTAQSNLWSKARRIYRERGGKFVPVYEEHPLGLGLVQTGLKFETQELFNAICAELGGVKAFMR